MARTLLTGATGLIGGHLARALIARGDDVRALVPDEAHVEHLAGVALDIVPGSVLDRRAVRRALRGVERVFHAASLTSLRAPAEQLFAVNVTGTRVVLEEALRAGVARVVHTSSIGAIGPAPRGTTADETQIFTAGSLGIPYVNAKHEAEREALRLAAQGLPVVIVNPAHVFGRGDVHGSTTEIVRRFLRREIPAYVEGAINIVDAADVAVGHLAADERGRVGERYILGNRNYTLDRLFADLGRLSGVEPPALKLPLTAALAFARVAEKLPGPPLTEVEVRATGQWWAYRNAKARRELGWKPRPHEDTLEATVAWHRERGGGRLAPPGARQPALYRLAGLGLRGARAIAGPLAG